MRPSSLVAIVALSLPLAACASAPGLIAPAETAYVSKVDVALAPNVASPRFAELVRSRTDRYAARFGKAGSAKELRIVVNRHSYKNPAMSLLVGDANYAGGRIAVVDVASGRVQGEADAAVFDTLAINGVAGAIIAAAQNKEEVDGRLADAFAKAALTQAYGSAKAGPVLSQPEPAASPTPPATPATAAPTSGPSPKPSAPAARPAETPKPAPVAAKPQRTAMVAIPTPTAR